MKILTLADLHFNVMSSSGCTEILACRNNDYDAVLLCGDNAAISEDFGNHHELFRFLRKNFQCPIGFVAGNHELWGNMFGISSQELLHSILPRIAKEEGLSYLEKEVIRVGNLNVSGTYGHYDSSLSALINADSSEFKTGRYLLSSEDKKLIWHDLKHMSWDKPSRQICDELISALESRISGLKNVITISHTVPSFKAMGRELSEKQLFYSAFSGTTKLADMLKRNHQIKYHFCGHTHARADEKIGNTRVINIGSDYELLRICVFDTDSGKSSFESYDLND